MTCDGAVEPTGDAAGRDPAVPSPRVPSFELDDVRSPYALHVDPGPREHVVLLYESERALSRRVVDFLTPGLLLDEGLLVVATPVHRRLLRSALTAAGADLTALRRDGTYVELDAEETLAGFLVDGRVSAMGFNSAVGHRIRTMSAQHGRVHIYGEMVACLWGRGGAAEAVELEHLWNELARHHDFRLCCAYPTELLGEASEAHVDAMQLTHSAVERH